MSTPYSWHVRSVQRPAHFPLAVRLGGDAAGFAGGPEVGLGAACAPERPAGDDERERLAHGQLARGQEAGAVAADVVAGGGVLESVAVDVLPAHEQRQSDEDAAAGAPLRPVDLLSLR